MSDDYMLSVSRPADCTPEEVERVIQYLASLPLEEVRRRQDIVTSQTVAVTNDKSMGEAQRTEAYRQLSARSEHLQRAVLRIWHEGESIPSDVSLNLEFDEAETLLAFLMDAINDGKIFDDKLKRLQRVRDKLSAQRQKTLAGDA